MDKADKIKVLEKTLNQYKREREENTDKDKIEQLDRIIIYMTDLIERIN